MKQPQVRLKQQQQQKYMRVVFTFDGSANAISIAEIKQGPISITGGIHNG